MTPRSLLSSTTAICLLSLPTLAQADIAPADVWANLTTYASSLGGDLTAEMSDSGDTLIANDILLSFALPMDVGTVTLTLGTLSMMSQSDGSVNMITPKSQNYVLNIDPANEDPASVTFAITSSDDLTVATGTPGDVSYSYSVASYVAEVKEMGGILADPDLKLELSGNFTANDIAATSRIIEGNLLNVTGDMTYASYSFDNALSAPGQPPLNQSQRVEGAGITYEMALPNGGVSLLNLAAALRDGLSISLTSTAEKTEGSGTQMQPGMGNIEHTLSAGQANAEMSFDRKGVAMNFDVKHYAVSATLGDFLPFPVAAQMGEMLFDVTIPVLAENTPSDAVYAVTVGDLTLSDDVWGLFDPAAKLPRDPATITLDMSGQTTIFTDLLDFAAMEKLESAPLEPNVFSLDKLLVSLAGAELTGTGGFTFDNSDTTTFDGMPAPTGAVDLKLVGGNGLMDKLVEMGLLPKDQAMGARMMMGLFATPGEGEDSLTTKIEIDGATGAISANGQRLQ